MDLFKGAERSMGMSDATWACHANPISVWTRFTTLPLLILALWSRDWIGAWALIPVALALGWIWWNPRAFSPPGRFDSWASKGVLGERVFLNRKAVPIPAHHHRAALVLSFLSATGLPPLAWGIWALDWKLTFIGLVLVVLPKVWFVDRMVWLYEDMRATNSIDEAWPHPRA